ncbi:FAD-dependent hydroxylase [Pantanalinema rosaneae CENA516]|uniref:FAD-dependent hydroxylase n=1 Tax=Pantanalinema rosaneae TaxID=1620701 RepID=UPI003D6EA3EE
MSAIDPLAPHDADNDLIYDVVIVGCSVVGLVLACGLQSSGLRVAIVEAKTPQQAAERPRAYALSPQSAHIFRALGLWEQIAPAIAHFPKVVLSDANYPHRVEFLPDDIGEPAVYYCAEHTVLVRALQQKVAASPTVTCWYETQVVEVNYGNDHATLMLSHAQPTEQTVAVNATLVVAADGANSPLRIESGIKTSGWKYWQSCITAFISPAPSHQNIAYERFWSSGPFAILPLPDNRCQIVWTASHTEAKAIAALPPTQFMAEIKHRYGNQASDLTLLSDPLVFPIRLMQSQTYCKPRLALVGDAAHCCHPIGGQGLNMGIRDAAALTQVLQMAQQQHRDIGGLTVLKSYDRWRRYENWIILLMTDLLNRTFSNRWLPLIILRRIVLHGMIAWTPLRQLFLRLMTGLWGRPPQLSNFAPPVTSVGSRATHQNYSKSGEAA